MSSSDFGLSLSGLQILWLPVRRAHWLQAQRSCGVSRMEWGGGNFGHSLVTLALAYLRPFAAAVTEYPRLKGLQ